MEYIAGCSASLTGRARIARSASLSEFQYPYTLMPRAMNSAMTRPVVLNSAPPITRMIADMPPSSRAVLRPLK